MSSKLLGHVWEGRLRGFWNQRDQVGDYGETGRLLERRGCELPERGDNCAAVGCRDQHYTWS